MVGFDFLFPLLFCFWTTLGGCWILFLFDHCLSLPGQGGRPARVRRRTWSGSSLRRGKNFQPPSSVSLHFSAQGLLRSQAKLNHQSIVVAVISPCIAASLATLVGTWHQISQGPSARFTDTFQPDSSTREVAWTLQRGGSSLARPTSLTVLPPQHST